MQNFVLSNHGTNDYSGYGFEISISTTGPYGNIWSSSAKYFNGGGPNLVGMWVHLWVIQTGGKTLTIYYNGTASTTTVDVTNFPTASPFGWQINGPRGAIAAGAKVADVRFYSGVVSPSVAMTPIAASTAYAMSFNGTSQYGKLTAGIPMTATTTLECWVMTPAVATTHSRILQASQNGTANKYTGFLFLNSNNFAVAYDANGTQNNTPDNLVSKVPINTWTHVALTTGSTGIATLYINGAQVSTTQLAFALPSMTRNDVYWGTSSISEILKGFMTELRLWNVQRTAAQIAANYNKILTGTETGLQLYIDSNSIKNCSATGLVSDKTGTYSMQMQSFSLAQITPTTALQLTNADPVISFLVSPTSINLTWPTSSGITQFRLLYKASTDAAYQTYVMTTSRLNAIVSGLMPSTTYNFQIYGLPAKTLLYSGSAATTAQTLSQYTKNAITGTVSGDIPALSSLTAFTGVTQESLVAAVLSTGDKVKTTAQVGPSAIPITPTVVQQAGTLNIKGVQSVYIPFSSAVVSAQSVSLVDSNNNIIPVIYGTNKITVSGVDHAVGTKFVIDGRLATVLSK